MLEQHFLGFINDNRLFTATDRVLLAVSGGLDSVVMAEVFQRSGQPFAIAHVNFGLRGTESAADAIFVENKAKQYEVPFHITEVDTRSLARERGISIQMAAREFRYNWFAQLLRDHNYACVATAHHQNDVLETMLLNLTRGTGVAGLRGIAPRQGNVVRPLLMATRAELSAYAQAHALTYREDSSNADDKYARNRIRHHVVPVLEALNPGLWETLPRTIERLRATETLVRNELERSWADIAERRDELIWLPADKLLALPEMAFRLAEWLKPFGFTGDQARQISITLASEVGQVVQSASHRITHERGGLLLAPLVNVAPFEIILTHWPASPVDLNDQYVLRVTLSTREPEFRAPTDAHIACLDADRLQFPLTIRPWRQGDRIRPLGMKGSKLVSDVLNDLKVSRSERENALVLLSGDQIVWVVGRRISHSVRITSQTSRIVELIWQRK
ncbi:tRNA lysidine(34) synthetase TilS [Spirosoma knui]